MATKSVTVVFSDCREGGSCVVVLVLGKKITHLGDAKKITHLGDARRFRQGLGC
jgi:hypothetical protein